MRNTLVCLSRPLSMSDRLRAFPCPRCVTAIAVDAPLGCLRGVLGTVDFFVVCCTRAVSAPRRFHTTATDVVEAVTIVTATSSGHGVEWTACVYSRVPQQPLSTKELCRLWVHVQDHVRPLALWPSGVFGSSTLALLILISLRR